MGLQNIAVTMQSAEQALRCAGDRVAHWDHSIAPRSIKPQGPQTGVFMTFFCKSCGKEHDSLPEPAYQRPDDVWALSPEERAKRVSGGNDLCSLRGDASGGKERFFLRGVVPIQVPELDDTWAIGIWVEVSESDFHRYRELFSVNAASEPRFPGVIANAAKGFADVLGAWVSVQLGSETQRPTFWFPPKSECSLGRLQQAGITLEEIHALLGQFD